MPWGDHRGAKGASPRIARRLATTGPPASGVAEVLTPSLGGRVLLTELTKHGLAEKGQEGTRLRGLLGRRGPCGRRGLRTTGSDKWEGYLPPRPLPCPHSVRSSP